MSDVLDLQNSFQKEVFKRDLGALTGEEHEKALYEMTIALYGEVAEFCESMRILPWKKSAAPNLEIAREELIDIHHFLNNLYLLLGFTNDSQVEAEYLKKLNKNYLRGKVHGHDSHTH